MGNSTTSDGTTRTILSPERTAHQSREQATFRYECACTNVLTTDQDKAKQRYAIWMKMVAANSCRLVLTPDDRDRLTDEELLALAKHFNATVNTGWVAL